MREDGWHHTFAAAPPLMIDLTKIPRSTLSSVLLPFTLIPRPAEPRSFNGIVMERNSSLRVDIPESFDTVS